MTDRATSHSEESQGSRQNPRQHKQPTRRRADQGTPHGHGGASATAASAAVSSNRPSPANRSVSEAAARATREHHAAAAQSRPRAAHPTPRTQAAPAAIPAAPQVSYAGYAQAVGPNPRVAPAQKLKGQMAAYTDVNRYKNRKRKKTSFIGVIAALVILAAIGAGAYFYLNPPTFNITVNGMTRTVNQGTTVADLVADDVVSVTPGNLVDVEGVLLEEGAGELFSGTINGNEITNPTAALHKGDSVQLGNGTDKTEEYSVETITTEPGYRELGEGSLHVYVTGQAGQTEKRTGSVSGKVVDEVVQPAIDNMFFKYNANPDEKAIALTFDDGPWATTPELLDVLKQNDAKVTFFTIGYQIADNPEAVKREADEGHQICTHSWDHAKGSGRGVDLTRMSTEEQIAEVQKGIQAIADVTGTDASTIIRAPGGNFHDEVVWTVQPYITGEVGWNIDTEDWQKPGVDAIAQRIMGAKPGDVILMHDGGGPRTQTIEALKIALPYLKERGYKFVTIDQLLTYDDARELAIAAAAAEDAAQG